MKTSRRESKLHNRKNIKKKEERKRVAADKTLKSEQWELRIERNGDH